MANLCSFSFCTGCNSMHASCISLSCSIISNWASFMIGLSDTRSVASAHVTKYSLWLTSVIWHSSLCFYNKPCVLDASIMYITIMLHPFLEIVLMHLTHCINHSDQAWLYQSEICVINHMCFLAYLMLLDMWPNLDTHLFKEIWL